MTEKDIVKKVCEILEIKFHHYDNHRMSLDYFRNATVTAIPKIVLYSTEFGPFEFAILEDMSIFTFESDMLRTMLTFGEKYIDALEGEPLAFYHKLLKKQLQINKAEYFLKENNCVEIINNPNKKINI